MFRQLLFITLAGLSLAEPSDKVAKKLKDTLANQGTTNVVVSFAQKTNEVLERINGMRFTSREAKITRMKAELEELQQSSQKNAVHLLSRNFPGVNFHALWITNRIYIEDADEEVVSAIAGLPEVVEVREEFVASIGGALDVVVDNITVNTEWGINKIEAEQAWALPGGNNGEGVVVSIIDTGVRGTHEALRSNYRGSYGWFDPYDRSEDPADLNGHGTHVMGTLVGSGGIGVAPGAQWISCRGCNPICFEAGLTRCGQWVLCPTLPNGDSPDCSKAPALASNSWIGAPGQTWYYPVIDAWHAAGIIPVFAQGNGGPNCRTAQSPGDSPDVIGVGSTDSSDSVAPTSSRGPTYGDVLKPDVSAPGLNITSSHHISDDAYRTMTGTSMATPHVSGTIALLLSSNPKLTYAQIKDLLQKNADRNLGEAETCGNTPPTQWPNNIYGHGRINARKSLAAAINHF